MTGIVITPVETTFEIAAPDKVPKSAELATAAWAAPPVSPPATRFAIFIRRSPAPDAISTPPNTMKINTFPETTCRGWPNMPPVCDQKLSTIDRMDCENVDSEPARTPIQSGIEPRTKK